jgi:DDE superfamily endonuclease
MLIVIFLMLFWGLFNTVVKMVNRWLANNMDGLSKLAILAAARESAGAVRNSRHRKRILAFIALSLSMPAPAVKRNFVEMPVELMPDSEFSWRFRFEKLEFPTLLAIYDFPERVVTPERVTCSGWTAMGILLRRMVFPNRWIDLPDVFGRDVTDLKLIFKWSLQRVYSKCRHRIMTLSRTFLNDERLLKYCDAIQRKGCPFPRCFGFIDGTVYQLCRPGGNTLFQRSIYSGYKRYHGLKFQAITGPDGLILALSGPYPARANDSGVLRISGILDTLITDFGLDNATKPEGYPGTHFSIYGDGGNWLLCAYPGFRLLTIHTVFQLTVGQQ